MEASSDIQQRNLELTRHGFEAYNSGDYGSFIELLHPDVELHADHELLNSGDFRGPDGVMQWSADWLEAWDEFHVEPTAVETLGDHWIIADSHQVARGAGSGVHVEMDVFWALEVDAGAVRRMHIYANRDDAVAAVERWRAGRDA